MKQDYLWDGSGEPDWEVQQLEQALGRLRFEHGAPPPLRKQTPEMIRRRSFAYYLLAAAAAVVLMMTAFGFWARFRGTTNSNVSIVRRSDAGDVNPSAPPAPQKSLQQGMATFPRDMPSSRLKADAGQPQLIVRRSSKNRSLAVGLRRKQAAREAIAREQKDERERGLNAKENLMLALRIASSELRDVHKLVYADAR